MHEIITLQLGQRANYLGTHFWNSQESYFTYSSEEESLVDHDVHFRPGRGADGSETFTPRTVIYDLKGGFGSLKKINALYEATGDGPPQGVWNGPTVLQKEAQIPLSSYQQSLEEGESPPPLTPETVRYWSDFNRVYFHPRSIVQLNDYDLNSSLMPFEKFSSGEQLFDTLDKEHDLLDRDLRPFAEEADHMQGIQIMASLDDAWGGFAVQYLDRIRDEFGKTSVWVWGLENELSSTPRAKQFLQLSNTAQSIAGLAPQASLLIPMTLPSRSLPSYVTTNGKSLWHSSALLCTALETMTLPSRLKPRNAIRETLDGIAAALNVNGNQNVARLQMSVSSDEAKFVTDADKVKAKDAGRDNRMPDQNGRALTAADVEEEETIYDMSFFPVEDLPTPRGRGNTKKTHVFGQSEVYRSEDRKAHKENDDFDGHDRARRRAAGLPVIHKDRVPLSYSILDSFPSIYDLPSTDHSSPHVAVRTALSTDTTVALRIKGLRTIASRSIGVEEREGLTNALGDLAEAYEEGYDSGSDSDDD